jgi:hypothetical protein
MELESDYALAKTIAEKLSGRFWEVTLGEWWVVVEGISSHKLVILTNDPFGIAFTPCELTMALEDLRKRIMQVLLQAGVVSEDGSWAQSLAG